jgi:hypothetical protein
MNLTNDSASSGSLSMSVWVEGLELIGTIMGGIGVKDDQRWVRAGPSRAATYEGDVPRFRDGRGHVRHFRLLAGPWNQRVLRDVPASTWAAGRCRFIDYNTSVLYVPRPLWSSTVKRQAL